MTTMTTMEAIAAICADRRAAGRIPVLATDGEVSGITGMSRPETEREMDRLAAAGKVVTGRTVSGRYAFPAETETGMSGCTCSKTTDYTKDQSMSKMFEKAIKAFLDDKAAKDQAFAEKYRSGKKSIADCCKFIIAEVKKSCKGNEAACTDEYVYGLAMHYYDEEKQKLFDAMAKAGKRWNAEKKVVESIQEPEELRAVKSEIKSGHQFKKGEPVLVRSDYGRDWTAGIYVERSINPDAQFGKYGVTDGRSIIFYRFCIPYNERTMHLLGTTKDYKEEQS